MSQNKKQQEDIASMIGIPSGWINKFTIATTLFVVWMTFFDQHNVFAYLRLQGVITKMEVEKESYNEQIAQAIKDKQDLDNDKEKFAREKHLMHKSDEEIILIETNKKKK
jgi:cell division protein DivIC